jgi:hypothetical protein
MPCTKLLVVPWYPYSGVAVAGDVDQVLHRYGNAMEGAERIAAHHGYFRSARGTACSVGTSTVGPRSRRQRRREETPQKNMSRNAAPAPYSAGDRRWLGLVLVLRSLS